MAREGRFTVTVFGLGEAGSLFAADLARNAALVQAYDPAPVATPSGVVRCADPSEAVEGADVVLALVAEHDMRTAVSQAAGSIAPGSLYADCGSGSPGLKRELAAVADAGGFSFVDIGMMAMVPGYGVAVPSLASGAEAERFVELMTPFGMDVTAVDGGVGEASARKLLRSVVVKGLAALLIESLRAAEKAGCRDWVWENVANQIASADRDFLVRLLEGTAQHHLRRTDEMVAATSMLEELGIEPRMTRSTVAIHRIVPDEGVPSPG